MEAAAEANRGNGLVSAQIQRDAARAAYGTLAALLTATSLMAENGPSSAAIGNTAADGRAGAVTSELGTLLFATKGCVGCHMHAAFPSARMQFGPDLTGLAEVAATRVAGLGARAYVRQSLDEPGAYRVSGGYTAVMPDLGLSDEDIEALTAFLLSYPR